MISTLFSAGKWDERDHGETWPSIGINTKSVRGTTSNRLSTKDQDPAKLDASIQSPNLQTVDVATLPNNADTLRARFTLRVLGGAGTPSACNNAAYQARLQATVQQYVSATGFAELARRYASNLANGRFLRRNRMGADQIEIQVRQLAQGEAAQSWRFQALDFSLRHFDTSSPELNVLAQAIEHGLSGQSHTLLEVIAYARIGDGQEVYPSQELILGGQEILLSDGKTKSKKSRTLYKVGNIAAMQSQKIGNALRTIDTWYPKGEADDDLGPIAVEPYGSVTSQGKAYRLPREKANFYNLLDTWVFKDEAPGIGDQHFVMATLIRGGVFGKTEKD